MKSLFGICVGISFLVYVWLCAQALRQGRNRVIEDIEAFFNVVLRYGQKVTGLQGARADELRCAFTVGLVVVFAIVGFVGTGVYLLWAPYPFDEAYPRLLLFLAATLLGFVAVHLADFINRVLIHWRWPGG